jgi:hypothetical protein
MHARGAPHMRPQLAPTRTPIHLCSSGLCGDLMHHGARELHAGSGTMSDLGVL